MYLKRCVLAVIFSVATTPVFFANFAFAKNLTGSENIQEIVVTTTREARKLSEMAESFAVLSEQE